MTGFQAIILICLNSVPSDQCTEATATDVLSKHVETELGCASGWQEVIGRSAQAYEIGRDAYVRTVCRRSRDSGQRDGGPREERWNASTFAVRFP